MSDRYFVLSLQAAHTHQGVVEAMEFYQAEKQAPQ